MTPRTRAALLALALLTAACGGGVDASVDSTSTAVAPASTTTAAATRDSEAPTTSAAPETTTTALETTTSTTESDGTAGLDGLMAAMDGAGEVRSARVEGLIELTGLDPASGMSADVSIPFTSAYDLDTGDSAFSMDMSGMMGAIEEAEEDPLATALLAGMMGSMEVRQIGERAFLRFPMFTAMFGAETDWVSMPAEDSDEYTSGMEMPSDPDELLETYRDADATVEEMGSEPVNGTDATHYRVVIDTEAMLEDLSAEERAELEAEGLPTAGEFPMDLWIDGDGHLVRMVIDIDGSTIEAAEGEGFERMTLRYDVYDINGDVVIEEPPADEVTAMEDLTAGFEFGDLEPEG